MDRDSNYQTPDWYVIGRRDFLRVILDPARLSMRIELVTLTSMRIRGYGVYTMVSFAFIVAPFIPSNLGILPALADWVQGQPGGRQ